LIITCPLFVILRTVSEGHSHQTDIEFQFEQLEEIAW